jgi:hypothetical protein
MACYERNVTQINKNRKEAQLEALIHYSGTDPPQCANPFGEHKEPYTTILALQLDHIKGNGAKFRRRHPFQVGKSLALWLRKRHWPKGYRVLCANCQCIARERLGNDGRK